MERLNFHIDVAGDCSILVQFRQADDEETNKIIQLLSDFITHNQEEIIETIIGYTSLLIHYDPLKISYDQLKTNVVKLIKEIDLDEEIDEKTITIPVLYGSHLGPDLSDVAQYNRLTEEEVIQIHTEPTYLVHFLGFSPGFPFLGGMSKKIMTPRLDNPRTRINAGSVGIANDQTGIYPVSSPGGWRLIGHTPIHLYEPKKKWPFLLSPGDRLKFKSITKEEYDEIINDRKNK